MVPSSLGSSGRGLPVVGAHLEPQQVGMCKEASGGLMCQREKLEILTGSAGPAVQEKVISEVTLSNGVVGSALSGRTSL